MKKRSYNISGKAAWIALVAGLMFTVVVALHMKSNVDMKAEQEFVSQCNDLEHLISDRLNDYALTLLSGAALFNAAEKVNREQWRIFAHYLKLENHFPGTQGIGFSLMIPRAELPRHIQEIRSAGFPDYTVKPEGDREIYSSVIYLEPFSERNLRALGYDMLSEPVRRAAMEHACDTNSATRSGKVTLVQETDKDIQAGVLMYIPVYRKGMPTDTVEQRRAAIYGWVYSPYRMNDLMRGIFRGLKLDKKKDFHFEVFDGGNPSPQNLIYENFPAENKAQRSHLRFTRQISHVFNGDKWTLCFTQTGGGFYTAEYAKVWLTLIGSILILILLKTTDTARQMAENLTVDLREKTSILSGLLKSIPDMVFFKTKEGVYLGCNPEFARFANRDIPDIVGSTDYDLFDKELADFFRTQDRIMTEQGMPRHNEEWVQYPDGARILLDTVKAPLMDADGRVLGLLGVGRDITDLKRATTELQNISERLSLAVRAGGVGIWDWDVVNNRLIWDEQMSRLYGTASDKLSSAYETWLAGLHPDDRQRCDDEIRLALSGEKEFNTEFRVLWPDGTIRNIRAEAIVQRDASGHPLHMLGTNWDITAQKQAENTRIQLIHALGERIKELNCIYGIAQLASTTDISLEDILQGIVELIPRAWQYPEVTCARITLNGQTFTTGNFIETRWRQTAAITLYGAQAGLLEICYLKEQAPGYEGPFLKEERLLINAVVQRIGKIAERNQLESEKARLEDQNRQLQKAESLGRMSGAIAHHFNNKLNVVMGYLEMVIRELPPGDSHAEKLARAMQSAQKASEVSGNLLAYLGQIRNKIESLDLSEICTVSLPVLLDEMPKNVALETDLPSPGPYISADAKQVQKILTSLVINAWEAVGEETGTVRLSVKIVSTPDIPTVHRFPLEWQPKEQCYACLEVTDSGCGIQGQDIEKIFDPFFSTKFTGRGLGLSIVLGIAKTHGAAITVETRINGGSVFKVFFPLSNQIPLRQTDQVAKAPENVDGGTVLLVEDEEDVRKMAARMLSSLGFTVLQAKDGIEAVEIFKQHKDEISCLLSDLTMPRMGGWETIAALRAIRRDLPVVLASGYDEDSVMVGEHPELPDFFLNKPYAIKKLSDTVCHAIARKTMAGKKAEGKF